jgi:sigma-B regulation protein RsbU (phosphoserine phosphatase)
MFSDGVIEARDAHDQEFGEQRLISCITAHRAKAAADMLQGILGCVQDFCKGTAQTDDITVTVTRLHGL